jgi:hypothetical protein
MNKKQIMKVSPLVGAVLLALSAPVAMATTITAPAANVLPGAFYSNNASSAVTYVSTATSAATITVSSGATVLQFGGSSASVTNAIASPSGITTAAGFNIGSAAALTIKNSDAAAGAPANVLVNDITGNPSQIYGSLSAIGVSSPTNLFIANANGVIVGSTGIISNVSGAVGLIGEGQNPANFTAAGDVYSSTGTGPVTIMSGASITNAGYLLVAGNGNVNVGTVTGAPSAASVIAGYAFSASPTALSATLAGIAPNTAAVIVNSGATVNFNGGSSGTANTPTAAVYAAGNVNVLGGSYVDLSSSTLSLIGGTFTNNGTATVANGLTVGGAFVNTSLLSAGTVNAGTTFTNTGTITSIGDVTAAGAFTNNGSITGSGVVNAGNIVNAGTFTGTGFTLTASTGTIVNSGTLNASNASVSLLANSTAGGGISNTGTIQNVSTGGLSATASSGSFSNTGTLNFATTGVPLTISATNGNVNLGGTVDMGTAGSALSSTNSLGKVTVNAGTSTGYINLGALLYASAKSTLGAATIHVASNGGFVDGTGTLTVDIGSGINGGYGYNLGMAGGSVLAAPTVTVSGSTTGSNVFLGGVLGNSSTGTISITANNIDGNGTGTNYGFAVSSGGALNITAGGDVANTYQGFTPLFNYLRSIPVNTGSSSGTVTITTDVTNSGTAQYVNLAVNGSPTMSTANVAPITATSGAIGASNAAVPFGQIALQATGNITNDGFYFPGRIVEANIQSVGSSTFGLNNANTIAVSSKKSLSNVVPGVVSSAGMIFLTDKPITLGNSSFLLTNTNSWYNFPASSNLATYYGVSNPGFYAATYANGTLSSTLVSTTKTPNNQFYGLSVMP